MTSIDPDYQYDRGRMSNRAGADIGSGPVTVRPDSTLKEVTMHEQPAPQPSPPPQPQPTPQPPE